MKISLNWIEEILGTKLNCSAEELSEKLLALGFEVASIRSYPECRGVVVAQILEISKHPNAERLQIAKITDGKETETVVCGAPNIAVGQKVFWAKVGAQLADGQNVKKSLIRGFPSPGMLCSAKELGAGEDHVGIWNLGEEAKPGKSLQEIVALKDTILDIEITPNRPDCLSHIGLAREIASGISYPWALNLPPMKSAEGGRAQPQPTSSTPPSPHTEVGYYNKAEEKVMELYPVQIKEPSLCLQYIARKITGVKVSPSPLPIQVRLLRLGFRPINNVVDITNLLLLEFGQPLHAFDADRLEGEKIVVRRALPKEKILALDGKHYTLDPAILVIADAKKAVAIAGVIGGEESEVTAHTKNILLESALFDKRSVRMARKFLNLSTESSYRFERGVTHWSCSTASAKSERMITEIAGGRLSATANIRTQQSKPLEISIRKSAVEKILGEQISQDEITSLLKKLGVSCSCANDEQILAQSPDWRTDLNLEIDFMEEIARLKGYEKIASLGRRVRLPDPAGSRGEFYLRKKLRGVMSSLGFTEAVNYGLISRSWAETFISEDFHLRLQNPISEAQSVLRPSLLPELLQNLKLNLSYQKKEVRLFEIGSAFQRIKNQPREQIFLAGVAYGNINPPHWKQKQPLPIDFFWLKGILSKFFSELQITDWRIVFDAEPQAKLEEMLISNLRFDRILHPATLFKVSIQTQKSWQPIGALGMLHPALAQKLDLKGEAALFELNLETLEKEKRKTQRKFSQILRTPEIHRDCSIWVEKEVGWSRLESEIRKAGGSILRQIELFDLYSDPKQPELKSLSFTLIFQDPEKTLSDETANQMRDRVVDALHKKFKAKLRERAEK